MISRFFLVGFMGSGKSTLGRDLALRLSFEFLDLDEWIEQQSGKSITDLFSIHGEAGFRTLESTTLRELKVRNRLIVSCGGGTPCHDNNMEWMNENGTTIFLNTPVEVLFQRLEKQKSHRPLIAKMNSKRLKSFIETRLAERMPYYAQARIELVSILSPETAVQSLVHVMEAELL